MCLLSDEISTFGEKALPASDLTPAPAGDRPNFLGPVFIWLVACALMIFFGASAITARAFPDPDDIMRLVEVRDWIGGQSWFDVTQYRLNGPAGVPMHWSRLVDVPIAAIILAARPLIGPERAETLAIVVVPLLTLGIAMMLVHRIASKILTSRAALAAVAATPLSLGALKQMRPMRIDHHGWQIVMALVALLSCFDQRPRRSGIIAGLAMALWLNISLEGLPFAAAIGGLFALEWLRDGAATKRLESYVATLAVASALIFAATHLPSTWMSQQHDVVTVAYLVGFATAALSVSALVRIEFDRWQTRLGALALAAIVTLSAMFLVDAHWLTGPFSNLDPVVRKFWYDRIDEGLPMWKVDGTEAAIGLAQPIVGFVGACAAFASSRGVMRERWAIYLFVLFAVTVSSLPVLRIATTASVIAMPGTAYLCQVALRRARAQTLSIVRIVATTGALSLMTPAYAVPAFVSSSDTRIDKAVAAATQCAKSSEVGKLRALPRGEIAAPLEVTPAIILNTAHRAIATGHHRNVAGMRDTIRLFIEPPASGEAIIKMRQADYIVMCHGSAESIRYARQGPHGLAAALLAGSPPAWLERTSVPGLTALDVWRVRKDLLRSAGDAADITSPLRRLRISEEVAGGWQSVDDRPQRTRPVFQR